jgi:RNase P/RNase MRP subunit POP5
LYGDVGYGNFGMITSVKFYDPTSNIFVVRTSRESYTDCSFAMACINEIKKTNLVIRSLRVASSTRTLLSYLSSILHDALGVTTEDRPKRDWIEGEMLKLQQIL